MAILSPKARRLIDVAVADLGDAHQKGIWLSWVRANNDLRGIDEPWQETAGRLPFEVAMVAIYAIEHMVNSKRRRREMPGLSEDELSDLDNDLSHAKSVEQFLVHAAAQQVGATQRVA